MARVAIFPGPIVRAIVVQQLNARQWHAVLRGDAPAGSLEAQAGGVHPFKRAVKEAIQTADMTGLPVLVEPYQQPAKPLEYAGSSRATWRHRFRYGSELDRLLSAPYTFGGAR